MGCGGTLVAKDVVLTASHCIFDPIPDSAYVTIGRTDLTSTDGEEIKVRKMIPHPDYSGEPDYDYDYALLVLERATTQDIKLITLNSDENFPAPGSVARIMGWGATDAYGTVYPDTPSEADVNVISKAECAASAYNNHTIEDFHICTFEQSKAFCNGDSGEIELS
jgi:trypsin